MLRRTGALLILMVLAFAATGCDEVTVDYDQDHLPQIKAWFNDHYSVRFANYAMVGDEKELSA